MTAPIKRDQTRTICRIGVDPLSTATRVLRFPTFEQKFNLPSRAVENRGLRRREHVPGHVGHQYRPVAPRQDVPHSVLARVFAIVSGAASVAVVSLCRRQPPSDQPTRETCSLPSRIG